MPPLTVSALVVTYNHARYVVEAIESALSQTYPLHEVIVVDDGSSDDTLDRVRAIGDERIRVLAQSHRGITRLAETYNVGVEAATGDLIAILEGDDRWPARKIEIQLPAFADSQVVVAHGPYTVIGARGTVLTEKVLPLPPLREGSYDALGLHLLMSYVMAVTAILRRSALRATGGFQALGETVHWDFPTFLALAEQGSFSYTNEVVGLWRKHGSSGTMALTGRDLEGVDLSLALAIQTRKRLGRHNLPSELEIERSWADAFARQMWHAGRVLIHSGRWAEARRLARLALARKPSMRNRLRVLALWIASVVRVDIEWLGGVLGRRSNIQELS